MLDPKGHGWKPPSWHSDIKNKRMNGTQVVVVVKAEAVFLSRADGGTSTRRLLVLPAL